ncbi:MAG: DNA replication and repair protein RecF [Elusimicrobiota bacterium]
MFIKELNLINFRNYRNFNIKFSDGTNIITGKNGTGKTNILEAIFLISTTISHRNNILSEITMHDENAFRITGDIINSTGKLTVGLDYKKGEGIRASLNSSAVKKNTLIDRFPVVMFSPEDIEVIKGPPGSLRRMMNIIKAQTDSRFIDILLKYNRILKERNALLKEGYENKGKEFMDGLNVWTKSLLKYAEKISDSRREFIKEINSSIQEETSDMGLKYLLKIKYNINNYNSDKSINDDIACGCTTWGPHRESFCFYLDGKNLRKYGSRGEVRIGALIFRMAAWRILKEKKGKQPIVLLDDVFSELDEEKRHLIESRLDNVQSIMTATEIPAEMKNVCNIIPL